MKIIILGGNSPANKSWTEGMEAALKEFYGDISVYPYLHWNSGEPVIDLNKELELLQKELEGVNEYVIVGKSAGALLALKGIYEGKLTPKASIFLGTAISWGQGKGLDVDVWLKDFSIPTLFIHQVDDPVMTSNALEKVLEGTGVKNYQFHQTSGNNHEYSEYRELGQLIVSFLKSEKLN